MVTFSVILPIYNVDRYLAECLDSVLCQSFKDYEIILVDDGSTDSSPAICDEYAAKYGFIKVIHKPNGGLSDARNVGLNAACGEYVFFVDSDDYLLDNRALEKIFQRLETCPDVVMFKSVKWFESTGQLGKCDVNLVVSPQATTPARMYLEMIDNGSFTTCAWNKVLRRKLLIDNDIEFEKGLLGEDNDWYYKVVTQVTSLVLIDEVFYVYRQRAGSITKSATKKNIVHVLWIIEKWEKYVSEGEMNDIKTIIRNDLARQYCNAVISYSRQKAPKEFFSRFKRLNYLLQFGGHPRVRTFRKINSLFGLRGTITLLRLYDMIKK